MPTIDYRGRFHACGVATSPAGTTGALRFPIRCSRASNARRFANKEILKMLPGWDAGTVVLRKDGKRIDSWTLRRQKLPKVKEES